jgi:ATP-dependent DNA helicase RecG
LRSRIESYACQNNAILNQESQHTEWKKTWCDDYLRWVCGFANAQGGGLLLG